MGVGVGVNVGDGVIVGVAVEVATGSSASPIALRSAGAAGIANAPSAIAANKIGTRTVLINSDGKPRGDGSLGNTREGYSSDARVSSKAWRWLITALLTTLCAIGLAIAAIVARPDARRAPSAWADEFDSPTGGWAIDPGAGEIADGALRLRPSQPDSPTLAMRRLPAAAFVAETRAAARGGSTDNGYGVVTGQAGELTAFLISGDGYFSVMRQIGADWIETQPWRAWPHVRRAGAANTLRLECAGGVCAFYVNEEITAQVDMKERERIGLLAWRYAAETTTVNFEYVRIWSTSALSE